MVPPTGWHFYSNHCLSNLGSVTDLTNQESHFLKKLLNLRYHYVVAYVHFLPWYSQNSIPQKMLWYSPSKESFGSSFFLSVIILKNFPFSLNKICDGNNFAFWTYFYWFKQLIYQSSVLWYESTLFSLLKLCMSYDDIILR